MPAGRQRSAQPALCDRGHEALAFPVAGCCRREWPAALALGAQHDIERRQGARSIEAAGRPPATPYRAARPRRRRRRGGGRRANDGDGTPVLRARSWARRIRRSGAPARRRRYECARAPPRSRSAADARPRLGAATPPGCGSTAPASSAWPSTVTATAGLSLEPGRLRLERRAGAGAELGTALAEEHAIADLGLKFGGGPSGTPSCMRSSRRRHGHQMQQCHAGHGEAAQQLSAGH